MDSCFFMETRCTFFCTNTTIACVYYPPSSHSPPSLPPSLPPSPFSFSLPSLPPLSLSPPHPPSALSHNRRWNVPPSRTITQHEGASFSESPQNQGRNSELCANQHCTSLSHTHARRWDPASNKYTVVSRKSATSYWALFRAHPLLALFRAHPLLALFRAHPLLALFHETYGTIVLHPVEILVPDQRFLSADINDFDL